MGIHIYIYHLLVIVPSTLNPLYITSIDLYTISEVGAEETSILFLVRTGSQSSPARCSPGPEPLQPLGAGGARYDTREPTETGIFRRSAEVLDLRSMQVFFFRTWSV